MSKSSVSILQSIGKQDQYQWTLIDLRPIREALDTDELFINDKYAYELRNYDLLLISPEDQHDQANY